MRLAWLWLSLATAGCGSRTGLGLPPDDLDVGLDTGIDVSIPPPTDRCPAAAPDEGSPCALAENAECFWDNCMPAGIVGQCADSHRWHLTSNGCSIENNCPPSLPTVGSSCRPPGGYKCSYRNACGLPTTILCDEGSLRFDGLDDPGCVTAAGCPSIEPAVGSPVAAGAPAECVYGNGCGGVDLAINGGSRGWFLYRAACVL